MVIDSVRPGDKQTEIGAIPNDWELVSVGDNFDFKNGLNKAKGFFGKGTPIVNYLDVLNNPGISGEIAKGRVTVSRDELRAFEVRKGDVLFTRTSETTEEIGMASAVIEDMSNTVFSGFVLRARPKTNLFELRFKQYCFRSSAVRRQIISLSSKTTRALTSGKLLSQVLVPVPADSREQSAIAEALSEADLLGKKMEELITKKKNIALGMMQTLLTGKKRLAGFHDSWRVKNFGHIFQFLNTANNPWADLSATGEIGYIHYGDVHAATSAFLDCSVAALPRIAQERVANIPRVKDGDLVIVNASEDYTGTGKSVEVCKVADREIVAGLHTFLLRGNKDQLADGFKGYLQFVPDVKAALVRLATGISVYGISKNNVRSIEAKLPDVQEQTAIANVLSDLNSEIVELDKTRAKYALIKKGMMQKLLMGRTRLV